MKKIALILMIFSCLGSSLLAQEDVDYVESEKQLIITHDDIQYIGKVISKDEREVLIETLKGERIIIPRYQVKKIRTIDEDEVTEKGEYLPEETFPTRYVLSTNAIALKRSESYMIWNVYGPDFQFGLTDHLSIGLMTTWIGIPLVGTIKYSGEVTENFHLGGGLLLGTSTWAQNVGFHFGVPFGAMTFGDTRNNLSISGGYGKLWVRDSEGTSASGESALFSIGAMAKISKRASFVFDSFILPDAGADDVDLALLIPAFRIQSDPNKAFQIGFAGVLTSNESFPVPFPMLQWFRKF